MRSVFGTERVRLAREHRERSLSLAVAFLRRDRPPKGADSAIIILAGANQRASVVVGKSGGRSTADGGSS